MKLYFAPRTRSVRPRWMLEELGIAYELVRLDVSKGETSAPEYLALHPLGAVPVLVDGDLTLRESAAICLYLADRFPEQQLAPPPGAPERGAYYGWLLFAEGSVESAVLAFYGTSHPPEVQATHRDRLQRVLGVVDAALEGREVLVGERFSAADVVMASILHLAHQLQLLEGHPRLLDYVRRHTMRPAVRRAVS